MAVALGANPDLQNNNYLILLDMKKIRLLTVALLLALTGYCAFSQNVYLMSVGVSDYPGTDNDLRLPVNDARSMVDLYKANSSAHTKILTDSEATHQAVVDAATSLFKNAGADDIVVFYFSGHGGPSGFYVYDKLLDYKIIKDIFAGCTSKHKMIFADSCHSGKLRETRKQTSTSPNGIDVMLFLSSRHNEYSKEFENMKNGLFTACLIKCLKGGADLNRDRMITAKELFTEVSKGVITLSHAQQHPVMWGNFDDNMPVMKW